MNDKRIKKVLQHIQKVNLAKIGTKQIILFKKYSKKKKVYQGFVYEKKKKKKKKKKKRKI